MHFSKNSELKVALLLVNVIVNTDLWREDSNFTLALLHVRLR